jgi:signal transduction histidine kinase
MPTIAFAQWAHDIRNTLGTMSLYLERLERPSEPETLQVVALTNALIAKAAAMCNDAIRDAGAADSAQRRSFDLMQTIAQVFDLVAPIVPAPVELALESDGPVMVMADPQDVFRILFNLIHNAVGVARRSDGIRRIELAVERKGASVRLRIADDGPGLPEAVRANLFRRGTSESGSTGYGLSIARELAERNGGMLELADIGAGTTFTLDLQGVKPNARRKAAARHGEWTMQPSFA